MKKYTKLTIRQAALLGKVVAYVNNKLSGTYELTLDIHDEYFSFYLMLFKYNKCGRFQDCEVMQSWNVKKACEIEAVFRELFRILPKYC